MGSGLTLAQAFVELRADDQQFLADLRKILDDAAKSKVTVDADTSKAKSALDRFAGDAKDAGKTIGKYLSLPAAGLEGLFTASAISAENATNTIIRQTGATGAALDDLQGSFKRVASGTSTDLGTVAQTLSLVYQRTGLTGGGLETLTRQILAFNKITKDAPITVDQLTKALAGFNVPGDKMGQVLDRLFVLSQRTGVPLAELLATLQSAGPVVRQFGLPIESAAALLTQLNLAGVDSQQVIAGLRVAMARFAQAGKDPATALREVLAQIDALVRKGDQIGARNLAIQVFGPRGSGLVDAALAGKLSFDQLGGSLDATGKGILDTAGKTKTLAGGLGALKNQAALAFAPLGEPIVSALNSGLSSLRPIIGDIGDELASWPAPVRGTIAGLVGLAAIAGPVVQTVGNVAQGLSALKDLRAGAEGAGSGFASFAGKAGIVGAVLLSVAGAAALVKHSFDQVDTVTVDLGADLAGLSTRELDRVVESLTSKFPRGALQSRVAQDLFNAALRQSPASAAALIGAYDRAGISTGKYEKQLDAATTAQARSNVANEKARSKIDDTAAAMERQAGSSGAATGALGTYTGATQDAATAQNNLRDAIFGVQDAQLGTTSAEIGAQQAQIRAKKAQEDYTKAVKEHGAGSAEAREAELERNAAIVEVAAANNRLAQAAVGQTTSLQDFNTAASDPEARKALLALLLQAQTTGPGAKAALQPYVDQLIFLNNLDPHVDISANTDDFQAKLNDAIAKALLFVQVTNQAGIVRTPGGGATFVAPGGAIGIKGPGTGEFTPPPSAPSPSRRTGQFFAEGGTPQPGTDFWVGEAGVPELMRYSADRKLTVLAGPAAHTSANAAPVRTVVEQHITIASDPRWSMRELALELAPLVGRELARTA